MPKIRGYLEKAPLLSGKVRFPFVVGSGGRVMDADWAKLEIFDGYTYRSMSNMMESLVTRILRQYDFPGLRGYSKEAKGKKRFEERFTLTALDRQSSGKPITAHQFLRLVGGLVSKLDSAQETGGFDKIVDEEEQTNVIASVYRDVFPGEGY